VLGRFSDKLREAIRLYRAYMAAGIRAGPEAGTGWGRAAAQLRGLERGGRTQEGEGAISVR